MVHTIFKVAGYSLIIKLWKSGFDYTDIVKCGGKSFLNSSSRDSISEYQLSSDNSQKDGFHKAFLGGTFLG